MAAEGLTDKAIAVKLGISPSTVNSHFRRLFAIYGTNSRTRLVAVSQASVVHHRQHEYEMRADELTRAGDRISELSHHLEVLADVLDTTRHGVIIEDAERTVQFINRALLRLHGVQDVDPSSLLGQDCVELAARFRTVYALPNEFLKLTNETFERRTRVGAQLLGLADGTMLTRAFVPLFRENEYVGGAWIYERAPEPGPVPPGFPLANRFQHFDGRKRSETIAGVLEVAGMSMGASGASYWQCSGTTSVDLAVVWRQEESKLGPVPCYFVNEELAAWASLLRANREVVCNDIDEEPSDSIIRSALARIGAKATLVVGVWQATELLGAVVFVRESPYRWSASDRLAACETSLICSLMLDIQRVRRAA